MYTLTARPVCAHVPFWADMRKYTGRGCHKVDVNFASSFVNTGADPQSSSTAPHSVDLSGVVQQPQFLAWE